MISHDTLLEADDEAELDMTIWVAPEYSAEKIDWAGRTLIDKSASPENAERALRIVNNWRQCHNFPLNTFQTGLRKKAVPLVGTKGSQIVAQRIKRLSSIRAKLERFNWLTLSVMQDLGGCRAVMPTVEGAERLVTKYLISSIKHPLADEGAGINDYIKDPKKSGYRGVHLIYCYQSDRNETFNGLKIEVQIRSQLQHAWATAVETVDTFTDQALKASRGAPEWSRFFQLMASAIARREKRPLVPKTPDSDSDTVRELRALVADLNVIEKLHSFSLTIQHANENESVPNAHYFVLQLDPDKHSLLIWGYPVKDLRLATQQLDISEAATAQNPRADAVLVSVDKMASLQKAYPNYHADTRAFIDAVEKAIQ